jgi:hypothetical protein
MKHAASATILLAFVCSALAGQNSPPTDEVMKADEQFRGAKLNRDTAALGRILADNFYETNQNGNGRNKTQGAASQLQTGEKAAVLCRR